jgi:hypothetical protein
VAMPPSPLTVEGIENKDAGGGQCNKRGGADDNHKQQEWSMDNTKH